MLPHPARPVEPADGAQPAGARHGNSGLGNNPGTGTGSGNGPGDIPGSGGTGSGTGDNPGSGGTGSGTGDNPGSGGTGSGLGNNPGTGSGLGNNPSSGTGSGLGNNPGTGTGTGKATSTAKQSKGTRGKAGNDTPAFVPPLAPSPPPGIPPTVHTRMAADRNGLSQHGPAVPAEQDFTEVQPGSFGSILLGTPGGIQLGEAGSDSSGRAYHLRGSSNPVQAIARLVTSQTAQNDPRIEDEQHRTELLEDGPREDRGNGELETAGRPAEDRVLLDDLRQHDDEYEAVGHHEEGPESASPEESRHRETPGHEPAGPEETWHTKQSHHPQGDQHGHPHPHEPDRNREPSQVDRIRRIAVTVCTAAALGAAYGLTRTAGGWPQITHSPGSVLDPAGSLLAAYAWVWLAWVPVLAGAALYAAWQWLPAQRTSPRQTWTGPISAGSAVVAALWIWAVEAGNPAAAFWLAALGVGVGLTAIHLSNTWAAESRWETAAADVPASMLLGAAALALLAGLGSWLSGTGANVAGWGPEAWALIALVATVIGVTTVSMTDRGHLAAALTVVAGLTGIGFARLLTDEISVPAAAGAFVGAFLILVSAGSRRHQVDHAQRRRQREWLKAEASVHAAGEAHAAVRT
ncbi:hypothetical protein [Arthrobacter koreensis]|uniref:hypothetical protein n=1 Tax=Arthrobacter koreensis TaxID=199136 RepID=UPI002DB5B623|nr:hypothetical protein [Arthrobacter koreensis]MEB7505043.1 hypothetical protein [Arthrobacter koreensis]